MKGRGKKEKKNYFVKKAIYTMKYHKKSGRRLLLLMRAEPL